jgi:hypothetical protein
MSNKKITQLPAKTSNIQAGDLFEIAEVQPGGLFVSKKLSGSQLISALPIGPTGATGATGAVGATGPAGPQGPIGPQGPAGVNAVSGITYAGIWDALVAYSAGDFVSYGNEVYICSTSVGPVPPSENPSIDVANWTLLSIQGAQGPAGVNGATGAQGPVGPQGPAGSVGPQGPVGPAGPQGIQGVAGPTGAVGPQGPAGPAGAVSAGSFTHWIGEKYEGGTIAHLWKDSSGVEHGLILCEYDVTWNNGVGFLTSIPWRPQSSTLFPIFNSNMDGAANTAALVSLYGVPSSASETYAAYLCDQLVYGGKSDWYLPSLYEMMAIKQNAFAINSSIIDLGAGSVIMPQSIYWTSTFLPTQKPVAIFGENYTYASTFISNWNNVRAIRKF